MIVISSPCLFFGPKSNHLAYVKQNTSSSDGVLKLNFFISFSYNSSSLFIDDIPAASCCSSFSPSAPHQFLNSCYTQLTNCFDLQEMPTSCEVFVNIFSIQLLCHNSYCYEVFFLKKAKLTMNIFHKEGISTTYQKSNTTGQIGCCKAKETN